MPPVPNIPGIWHRPIDQGGADSHFRDQNSDNRAPYTTRVYELKLGEIITPQTEPAYRNNTAVVEFFRGGVKNNVGWPGPNVSVNSGGEAGGTITGVHGFFDGPLPGQQVLMGFVEGHGQSPVVIAKYPYQINQKPGFESIHTTPLTSQGHGALDVGMGHYLGSYIALRTALPLPGNIEISSQAMITSKAVAGFSFSSSAKFVTNVSGGVELGSGRVLEPLVLGNELKSLLEDILDEIKNITVSVTSAPGTSGTPINSAAFTVLKGQITDVLSLKNKTD